MYAVRESLGECWFYQFDGPQMIACIVGSISPCLRFSALLSIIRDFAAQFVTRIVSGCSTNFMLTLKAMRESTSRAVAKCISHCVILSIFNLSAEQLQYEDRTFTRVQRLHRTHLGQASGTGESKFEPIVAATNTTSHGSGHIDDSALKIKDCSECRHQATVC